MAAYEIKPLLFTIAHLPLSRVPVVYNPASFPAFFHLARSL